MSWNDRLACLEGLSVRARLTWWYAAAFAAFGVALYVCENRLLAHWLTSRSDDSLMASVRSFEALYSEFGLQTLADEFRRESESRGMENIVLIFRSPNLRILTSSDRTIWQNYDFADAGLTTLEPGMARFHNVVIPGSSIRFRFAEACTEDGNFLQIGISLRETSHLLRRFRTVFVWICAGMLIFGTATGWLLTGRAMHGVEQVRLAAERIGESDLSVRVSPTYKGREVAELAHAFNQMLDRIANLLTAMRDVTDNMAHDLLSPITRIRGAAERALGEAGKQERFEPVAGDIVEECDRLVQMLDTLLDIAEARVHSRCTNPRPVDLTNLIHEVHDLFLPVADDRRIALRSTTPDHPVVVEGELPKLQRVVANLLDNALKFTPADGHVEIRLQIRADKAHIVVADTGPGIPPEEREKIFTRFYRLDASRSTPGHGLGLAFVRAVVKLHGGTVALSDNEQTGSRFTIELPLRKQPDSHQYDHMVISGSASDHPEDTG